MKQQITKEQWEELNNKQKNSWFLVLNEYPKFYGKIDLLPNIGQMIEFLDNNVEEIARITDGSYDGWFVHLINIGKNKYKEFHSKELCDALWGSIKYKLNEQK